MLSYSLDLTQLQTAISCATAFLQVSAPVPLLYSLPSVTPRQSLPRRLSHASSFHPYGSFTIDRLQSENSVRNSSSKDRLKTWTRLALSAFGVRHSQRNCLYDTCDLACEVEPL